MLRTLQVSAVNLLLLAVLLFALELGYRVYSEGFAPTLANFARSFEVPYSRLSADAWVIYDDQLAYRLNPARPDVNSRSVKSGEIETPKPAGRFRIIYLGDSIPYDQPGFVSLTRDHLAPRGDFEVINAGVPGYTSYQELEFFKRFLADTEPDLVIWTYCLNDNHRFLHRFNENARMLVTEEAERSLEIDSSWDLLVSRSYVLSAIKLGLLERRLSKHGKAGSRFQWEDRADFNIAWKDYSWDLYEEQLEELARLIEERGARLAIVVFPYGPQLQHSRLGRDPEYVLKPQRRLLGLCAKYGVACLDMLPVFNEEEHRRRRLFRDGIHLTPDGHAIAAEAIFDLLLAESLIPE